MEKYIGKSVYKGTAIGPVSVLRKKDSLVKRIHIDNTEEELKRLDAAKERTMTQLAQLYEKALQEVGEVNAAIFEVHQMMLEDDDYQDAIHSMIQNEEVNAEYAVAVTGDNFAEMFANMDDEYMQARSADVRDISNRLVRNLSGEEQIDWTVYQYRRHLIKVIKYCVNCGILNLNDGSEENFARDDTSEVLYENTGVSRYFMKNFTQDIMGYTTPEDQAEKESLSDSDTVKLKQREVEIKSQLEGLKKNITGKQRQEEEKKEKYQETEQKIQLQFQKNEMLWEEIENSLEYMEEEMAGVPFDEFAFMKKELTEQGIPFKDDVEQGVMIETPAAVMISDLLAKEVDFFSIGTNDLLQFTLGMDRTNAKIDSYYNPHHPALLKMIRIITNNGHLEEKRISICGDLAADLSLTEYFLQIGIDELSVAPGQVLGLRKKIREIQ